MMKLSPQRPLAILFTLLLYLPVYAAAQSGNGILDALAGEQPTALQDEQPASISAANDAQTDVEIQSRLEAIFAEIEALQAVRVAVNSGVVSLSGEVDNRADHDKALRLAAAVEGVVDIDNSLAVSRDLSKRMLSTGWQLLELAQNALVLLPLLLFALLVFAMFWLFGRWASNLQSLYRRISPNPFIAELLGQLVRLLCVIVGAVLALTLLDARALIGTVLGAAGLIGLAIGFAIRDTVENYIASILMSIRNPFDVNDLVNIDGYEGNVARLTSRATILVSPDGNHIRIANAQVFKAVIVNYSRVPERRFEFEVGVDADANLLAAQQLARETLQELPGLLRDPKPFAIIKALGDFNVILSVCGWVDQQQFNFGKVRSEAIRAVKLAFDGAGIAMPEPTYNVRLPKRASASLGTAAASPAGEAGTASGSRNTPDLSVDSSIEERVNELQAESDETNLLHSDTPKEL